MTKAYEVLNLIPGSIDDLPDYLNEKLTEWNYIFRNNPVLNGAFTIKAKSKADAIKKIEKKWDMNHPVEGLFVWSDEV